MTVLRRHEQALLTRLRRYERKRLTLVVIALYLAGYLYLRSHHLMVHAMGYGVSDEGRVVLQHRVKRGDFGVPIFSMGLHLAMEVGYWVYLPVRPLEAAAWYVMDPKFSVLPHTERSRGDLQRQKEEARGLMLGFREEE